MKTMITTVLTAEKGRLKKKIKDLCFSSQRIFRISDFYCVDSHLLGFDSEMQISFILIPT